MSPISQTDLSIYTIFQEKINTFIYLSIYLSIYLFIYLSIYLYHLSGKDRYGFGFGGTGKKSTNSQFDDYGKVGVVNNSEAIFEMFDNRLLEKMIQLDVILILIMDSLSTPRMVCLSLCTCVCLYVHK